MPLQLDDLAALDGPSPTSNGQPLLLPVEDIDEGLGQLWPIQVIIGESEGTERPARLPRELLEACLEPGWEL